MNHRAHFSHLAHFFAKDSTSECPFNIGKSIEYAERLLEKDLITEYTDQDPVASYQLTEKGENLVQELEEMLEETKDLETRFNYSSVPK